jgi:hypothetical protein
LRESKRFILVERQDTGLELSIRHEREKTADREGNCFPSDEMWADSNLKVLARAMVDGVTDTVNAKNRLGTVNIGSKNGWKGALFWAVMSCSSETARPAFLTDASPRSSEPKSKTTKKIAEAEADCTLHGHRCENLKSHDAKSLQKAGSASGD